MQIRYALFLLLIGLTARAQAPYFYPGAGPMNPAIPTPEQFLGYPLGTHQTPPDRMDAYVRELDRLSDRVSLETIGTSYERRPLLVAVITDPAHHARLDDIRQKHLARSTATGHEAEPLVVHLMANIHGGETSGGEASLLTAYYLAASESEETKNWLRSTVVLVQPCLNPDGRNRAVSWRNANLSTPPVADPADREHNEVWPGGRMNHYWFDPNRDTYPLVHPEGRAQTEFFHRWMPNVQVDHHEQGAGATFFFEPGKPSSLNATLPTAGFDRFYPIYSRAFADAYNTLGTQYFTKEIYDKLYPGYTSYSIFFGSLHFLFEQAQVAGIEQETPNGLITFPFSIRNQFVGALSVLRTSAANKNDLVQMRRDFFRSALDGARKSPVKGYVFGEASDVTRTNALAEVLLRHRVEVYQLPETQTLNGKTFERGRAFVVPTEQPSHLLVRAVFEKAVPAYGDSLFYDATVWSLATAYGLPTAELKAGFARGDRLTAAPVVRPKPVERSTFGYLLPLTDYAAHRALYALQRGGALVKTAFKPFTLVAGGLERRFGHGTLVIPTERQAISGDSLHRLVQAVSQDAAVDILALQTGLSTKGIDLGSGSVRALQKPQALLLVGPGVSAYEAGEVWHLLDQRVRMPITKVDLSQLPRLNLARYNVLVMVSGQYPADPALVTKLKTWVQGGGTLVTLKTATEWAIRQGFTKERLVLADTTRPTRGNFDEAGMREGARLVGGSNFDVDLDVTHPLGFGYPDRRLTIYRNGLTLLQPSRNPYATPAQYTARPLAAGYLHPATATRIANTAAVLVGQEGTGRVILFADNPNFRGYWYGTNKLFLNALFFGPILTIPDFTPTE